MLKGIIVLLACLVAGEAITYLLALPLPDTSWMRDPMPRERFSRWLDAPASPPPPRPAFRPLAGLFDPLRTPTA